MKPFASEQLLADRWALVLIGHIGRAPDGLRFTDLAAIDGLSRRVLAAQLTVLQKRGLVSAVRYSERPVRSRYALTVHGTRVRAALQQLAAAIDDPGIATTSAPVATEHPADALLVRDLDAAERIYVELLSPVARYDDQYRTSFLETLRVWLEEDGSVSRAAARLFTHRHTIRYRLDRVHELTAHDPSTSHGREQLMLGLRAHGVLVRAGRLDAPASRTHEAGVRMLSTRPVTDAPRSR